MPESATREGLIHHARAVNTARAVARDNPRCGIVKLRGELLTLTWLS